jgi:uncharacterized membrane protein
MKPGPLTIFLNNKQAFYLAVILIVFYPFFIISMYKRDNTIMDWIVCLIIVELLLIVVGVYLYKKIKEMPRK